MTNNSYIIVWDLETSGLSCLDDEIVQIAALAIDPHTLEIVPDSIFESLVKPTNLLSGTEQEIQEKWQKCWKAWEVNKKTRKQLEKAPLPEHVWKAFAAYVKKFNKPGFGGKPIAAGQNIQGFDLLFADIYSQRYKMADKYGRQQLFNQRTILDTLNIMFMWFDHLEDGPESLSMDNVRPWLGISNDGAHDALADVYCTSEILIRFLKFHRSRAKSAKFKNSMSDFVLPK